MPQIVNLRVGICCCTPLYYRNLHGRMFHIEGQWFQIQEVKIPERQHTKHIRHARCHFFIDIDTYRHNPRYNIVGYNLWATLTHYDFLPPTKPGRREKLKLSFYDISTKNRRRIDHKRNHIVIEPGQPNAPETVLRKIRSVIKDLGRRRNAWLRRMT